MRLRPPKSTRPDTLLPYTTRFRSRSRQLGMRPVPVNESIRTAISRYHWPGNVRELRNMIERTLILGAFPEELGRQPVEEETSEAESLEQVERRHILAVLKQSSGNREEAARRLGISRKTIDRKCAAWNV